MNTTKLILISIYFLFGNVGFGQDSTYYSEIAKLTNDSLKEEYLEKIFHDDQEIRSYWQESSINDTSYLSRKRVIEEVRVVDSINLIKVSTYLQVYGYPSRKEIEGICFKK